MATEYKLTAQMGAGYRTDVKVRDHRLILDEPKPTGDNAGTTAFEMLLAALAGCTAMTLRAYANHKKIDLEGVDLEFTLTRRDQAEIAKLGPNAKATSIIKKLKFKDSVPAELRQKLLDVAGKCPVNKALLEGCEIAGELA
ncbi:MAG: OsmC family protein [Planctomycetes bacterium]|nr:OsmC family protein [Planctomycetota bacterium]